MKSILYLIGFMGSGKSTVSKYLETHMHMKRIEMDQEIEKREGRSIVDIFAEKGEDYFRQKETELLEEIAGMDQIVVSCGGGIIKSAKNREIMKRSGKVVLLDASPAVILERLKDKNDRPLLKGRMSEEGIRELMDERRPLYEAAADEIIVTDGLSAASIAKLLVSAPRIRNPRL